MKADNKNKRRLLKTAIFGSALASVGVWRYLSAAPSTQQRARDLGIKGKMIPEISADYWIDPNGKETDFSMSEVHNKWVFLKCFQNWCPGCHKHGFPTLKKVADAFADHPMVSVLAIQTVFEGSFFNTQDAVRDIQLEYDLPIKMGHDVGTEQTDDYPETMIRFRTGGTPWIIVANPQGRIVFNDFHLNADNFIHYLRQQLEA